MTIYDKIVNDANDFIAAINRGLDELRIDRSLLSEMDHLCYRVETDVRYRELLKELSQSAELLGETMVSGRPIATFRLADPIATGGWKVSYVELPAPKEDSPYIEGLEHAELVVLGGDLERFLRAHSHLADVFSRKGMTKILNPELGLKAAGISVKFHKLPLGEVVRLEKLLESEQSA
jgi:predicted metalloenzyme YecM